jgi:hypothetical protein
MAVPGLVLVVALVGCVAPGDSLMETPPLPDVGIETLPAPDPIEDAVGDEVVFDSLQECLEGYWVVDNDSFADFFVSTDDRVTNILMSGFASLTVEGNQFRMFFEEWDIQYETGDPSFLVVRDGNETVDFALQDAVLEVVERDDQIVFEMFTLQPGDGEAIAIATNDPGFLPLDGATLDCTTKTLVVEVDGGMFFFTRV